MKMKLIVKEDSIPLASTSNSTTTTNNKIDTNNDRWSAISKMVDSSSTNSDSITSTSKLLNSPPTTTLDLKDKVMYGVRPLEQMSQNIIKCKDCGKPVLENALESHYINCQLIREKQQKKKEAAASDQLTRKRGLSEVSVDSNSSPKKSVTSFTLTHNKSVIPTSTSTSKKDNRGKQRIATIVDVNIHCGVMLDKGYPCSRSLTCKTHSMGAKRAVSGRSQPYDVLLNNWQKLTKGDDYISRKPVQARIGSGTIGPNGTILNGNGLSSNGKKRRKTGGGGGGGGLNGHGGLHDNLFGGKDLQGRERRMIREKGKNLLVVGEWEEEEILDEGEGMMVDSDEEVEKVLNAVQRGGMGKPLSGIGGGGGGSISNKSVFVGRNTKLARLRTVLGGVFGKM